MASRLWFIMKPSPHFETESFLLALVDDIATLSPQFLLVTIP